MAPEPNFFTAVLTIIAIDLVLAGDNAVVIALASRNLPIHQRKRAIFWGTCGAVCVRILMTAIALWLMRIPFLQAVGGLVLIPVAVHLLTKKDEGPSDIEASDNLFAAIKTIIVADAIMGVDNVLAIAGASHGNMLLVIFGLAVSVPIVVWGSSWLSDLMNRYPVLVYGGAGILAWTAGSMIVHDKRIGAFLEASWSPLLWLIPVVITVCVLVIGKMKKEQSAIQES
ncbi:TerC family protein [Acetonema longum]|uniref:Integral membrane protein TerC n=1 Tax=Acetonema longum DSM 6540 TaxID=1009370 RepID=F7NGJ1_9FIRM|nr:TerC family protein [Acetonema longum]EGO64795.1 hypothetical protein ALO_05895 [Acetonema longum DSM 6540]